MNVCFCTNACKGCGFCCQVGHQQWCPMLNPMIVVQHPLPGWPWPNVGVPGINVTYA